MKRFILTALLCVGISVTVNATEHGYDFRWQQIPVVCGETSEVFRYIEDNGFILESASVGRAGAKEDGEPAYFVSYFINKNGDQSLSAITSPSGDETCMLYRSFDLRASKQAT